MNVLQSLRKVLEDTYNLYGTSLEVSTKRRLGQSVRLSRYSCRRDAVYPEEDDPLERGLSEVASLLNLRRDNRIEGAVLVELKKNLTIVRSDDGHMPGVQGVDSPLSAGRGLTGAMGALGALGGKLGGGKGMMGAVKALSAETPRSEVIDPDLLRSALSKISLGLWRYADEYSRIDLDRVRQLNLVYIL